MSVIWSLLISLVLLALNGFFVAAEFALVAAKRHRLQQAATEGDRAAQAALAGTRELSMMLAGAQLGITLCTLALGALANPAVAGVLGSLLDAVGLPQAAASVLAVILAVLIVGFLHVVVGEVAPKSWAISDPEKSALLLARPFRAFTRLTRPVLRALGGMANACLRAANVTPQDELAQVHGPRELRLLLDSSREYGTIAAPEHALLTAMLQIQQTTVDQVMIDIDDVTTIDVFAPARAVERVSAESGRSRLVVLDRSGQIAGVVHVNDAVRATTAGAEATAGSLMNAPFVVPHRVSVARGVRLMRQARAQLAVVVDDAGTPLGVVALEDLLEEVIGEFDDETDTFPAAVRRAAAPVQPRP